MAEELKMRKAQVQQKIETVYFGGGTPSMLAADEISILMQTLFDHYNIDLSAEITLEANPDDLNESKLRSLTGLNINRLSIGIQSFNDQILKYLNRIHSAEEAIRSVELARKVGFNNLNLDLIFAIPGLTDDQFQADLHQLKGLEPEHISTYNLTIESRTVFGNWLKKGKITETDQEKAAYQYEMIMKTLQMAGYQHYEISNFALPGFHSRHNSSYWENKPYLGIGPGAHSYLGESRQANISHNMQYIKLIHQGKMPYTEEMLSRTDQINEYLMTSLRTSRGCNITFLKSKYDYELLQEMPAISQKLMEAELILLENNTLKLTSKGKLIADSIIGSLFLDSE